MFCMPGGFTEWPQSQDIREGIPYNETETYQAAWAVCQSHKSSTNKGKGDARVNQCIQDCVQPKEKMSQASWENRFSHDTL